MDFSISSRCGFGGKYSATPNSKFCQRNFVSEIFHLRTWTWDLLGIRKCQRSYFRGSWWIWSCWWKSLFFSSWFKSPKKPTFMTLKMISQKYFSEFVKFLKFLDLLNDVKSHFTHGIKSTLLCLEKIILYSFVLKFCSS